jgi:hypothetical protein
MVSVIWNFGMPRFSSLYVNVSINSEPDTKDGLYFQMYEGNINGVPFYFGLQTQVFKPGCGSMGRGVIFSRWKTQDLSNVRSVEGGWHESGSYEGDFVGIRKLYDWATHHYELRIAYIESDVVGDWYGLWIRDLGEGSEDFVGSMRFPKTTPNMNGIGDGGVSWLELYWKEIEGTPMPKWHVSINDIYSSDSKKPPRQAISEYSKRAVYYDKNGVVHLLIGTDDRKEQKQRILFQKD